MGMDLRNKGYPFKGIEVPMQIWDTGGQERFRAISRNYYKGCQGVLLVYDITNKKTFQELTNIVNDFEYV
jgi:GTPase SAR1 family protein